MEIQSIENRKHDVVGLLKIYTVLTYSQNSTNNLFTPSAKTSFTPVHTYIPMVKESLIHVGRSINTFSRLADCSLMV